MEMCVVFCFFFLKLSSTCPWKNSLWLKFAEVFRKVCDRTWRSSQICEDEAQMSFVCVSRRAMQGPYICERTHSQGLHEEGCATPHHEDRRQHSTMCVVFELSEMFFLQSQQILPKQHVQAIGWKSCPSRVVRRLHGLAEWLWFLFLFFWFAEVL